MKLVLTLLARDEEDILEANIAFHRRLGVDFVVATDNRSEDGTRAILERAAAAGFLHIIDEPGDDHDQARWVTRMAQMAARDFGADWVINSDADEFWYPSSGDLKSTLSAVPESFGVVVAPRANFIPMPEDGRPFFERMTVREVRSWNPVAGYEILPKVAHRGHPEVRVGDGNHRVLHPPFDVEPDRGRLSILHFPMRSYRQFEHKIVVGGPALDRNPRVPHGFGVHWREYYRAWCEGSLPEVYEGYVQTPEQIREGLAQRRLVEDHRVLEVLGRERLP